MSVTVCSVQFLVHIWWITFGQQQCFHLWIDYLFKNTNCRNNVSVNNINVRDPFTLIHDHMRKVKEFIE